MSASSPAEGSDSAVTQLEQLLARYIGPMAKIYIARAGKTAVGDADLIESLARSIDDYAEQVAFIASARQVLAARAKSGAAGPLIHAPEPAVQNVPGAAESQTEPSPAAGELPPDTRPAPRAHPAAAESAVMKPGAIFVSYARDNIDVAQKLVEALRAAGLEVWLDMGKLQAGDAWDLKIRRNIEACSFFLALISRETDARREGYFRREWNLAADRALNFSDEVPFILPVTVDDTAAYTARVPERFRGAHWTALPGGEVTSEFVDRLKELVDDYHRRK